MTQKSEEQTKKRQKTLAIKIWQPFLYKLNDDVLLYQLHCIAVGPEPGEASSAGEAEQVDEGGLQAGLRHTSHQSAGRAKLLKGRVLGIQVIS